MPPKYKDCGEFVQSVVRTGVCLLGALVGIAATSLYAWLLLRLIAWFDFRSPTELELAVYGFEAFAIWWATMVATAHWLYERLDAPVDDFVEIQSQRELLLFLRVIFGIGLVCVHVFSLVQEPRAIVGSLLGITVALSIISPIVGQVLRAIHRYRHDHRLTPESK